MKIYTKTGDDGTTALLNGTRVPKYHIRIDSYGTIDELSSYLGLVRDFPKVDKHTIEAIIEIQERLMTASSILASEVGCKNVNIPEIFNSDIEFLEKEMDRMDAKLPRLTSFVLPGGHTIVSQTHIARCVCRRAERLSIIVQQDYGGCENVVQYLNRLSDYLFTLARKFSIDFKAKEIIWKPRL
ncbi:MAG: cob(I)yrinic acid a,c-diamide adenosyltransferase [Salinivirgaceae bacterium]|nr:cob(I)yrinic acid a,c-diamide adenosyltransferase [Salinivirgaceae bacterium]MDD4746969.1 cob(I)yrinic acid a,c-diamide adenosyltransferase [Salinivirgaceae bacterium]MDY0281104.1 cob(I)yrinic acid a,c-diamide adenosyltransferase [Salinivirgaceae bacterium]